MEFQAFGRFLLAASAAFVLGAAGGCATGGGERAAALHVAAPATPQAFTRLQLTHNFAYDAAAPVPVAEAPDPSWAGAHEIAALDPASSVLAAHAGEAVATHDIRRIAGAAPEGWSMTANETLRHRLSGLDCPLAIDLADENRRFLLVQSINFDARGREAGCLYRTGDGGILALFASYWPEMSLAENYAGSRQAIDGQFDILGDLPLSVAALEGGEGDPLYEGLEEPAAGAFDIGTINGRDYKTSLWLVKTHGWHVKARASYASDDMSSELVSAIMFAFSHLNVRARNMNEPMAAGEI